MSHNCYNNAETAPLLLEESEEVDYGHFPGVSHVACFADLTAVSVNGTIRTDLADLAAILIDITVRANLTNLAAALIDVAV